MALAPQCQPLADDIADMQGEIEALQEQLGDAPPFSKAGIATRIRQLQARVTNEQIRLDACNLNFPPDGPILVPIAVAASGTVRLGMEGNEFPPQDSSFDASMTFSAEHRTFIITQIASISTVPGAEPQGNITTASYDTQDGFGSGTYNPANGSLSCSIPLSFTNSIFIAQFANFKAVFPVSTEPKPGTQFGDLPGSPVNGNGDFVASGTTRASGGYFNGRECFLTIIARIAPKP